LNLSPPSTHTISGTISPSGSGAIVTLSGAASKTATADTTGSYTFSGLASGSYTVAASLAGFTISPASQGVTVSNVNVSGVNFTATASSPTYGVPTNDVTTSTDQNQFGSHITSARFSTASANELLLAFISVSGNNAFVRSVTGAGLTWTPVIRKTVRGGSSEVWRAFAPTTLVSVSVDASMSQNVASSITVASFIGADRGGTNGSGAIGATGAANDNSGAAAVSLTSTRPQSLVFAVGVDYKGAVARTPVAGQKLIHQDLATGSNDTLWVQALNTPVTASGVRVTIADSAPTSGSFTMSAVEILGAANATAVITSITNKQSAVVSQVVGEEGIPSPPAVVVLSNPATGDPGYSCSPGGLASITAAHLSTQAMVSSTSHPLPTQLAGVQVLVNGEAAPLLLNTETQINFQCPLLSAGTSLEIILRDSGGSELSAGTSLMASAAPAIFTIGNTTQGTVLISSSNSIASDSLPPAQGRPARPAEGVIVYATGLGSVDNAIPVGVPAPAEPPAKAVNRARIHLGGIVVDPTEVRLVPGMVGVFQIEFPVPEAAELGSAVPLSVEIISSDGKAVLSNRVTMSINPSSK